MSHNPLNLEPSSPENTMNKLNKKPAKTTQIAKISCMLIGTLVCGFMASTANAQKTDGLKIAAGVLDIIGTAA